MNEFAQLTKKAFEDYHNTPNEPDEWTVMVALGHIMEYMAHHDSIHEMPGLREALEAMTPADWENWRKRYPEFRESLIEPIHREVTEQAH